VDEIHAGPAHDPARHWLETNGTNLIHPNIFLSPVIAAWDLGLGESYVLSWCERHSDYVAILDDGMARKCANILGIRVMGTLGILMLAKQQGHLDTLSPLLTQLAQNGFRINAKTFEFIVSWDKP